MQFALVDHLVILSSASCRKSALFSLVIATREMNVTDPTLPAAFEELPVLGCPVDRNRPQILHLGRIRNAATRINRYQNIDRSFLIRSMVEGTSSLFWRKHDHVLSTALAELYNVLVA